MWHYHIFPVVLIVSNKRIIFLLKDKSVKMVKWKDIKVFSLLAISIKLIYHLYCVLGLVDITAKSLKVPKMLCHTLFLM